MSKDTFMAKVSSTGPIILGYEFKPNDNKECCVLEQHTLISFASLTPPVNAGMITSMFGKGLVTHQKQYYEESWPNHYGIGDLIYMLSRWNCYPMYLVMHQNITLPKSSYDMKFNHPLYITFQSTLQIILTSLPTKSIKHILK